MSLGFARGGGGFEWIGPSGGDWFDADNWLDGGLPARTAPGCNGALGVDVSIPAAAGPIVVKCEGGGNVWIGSLDSQTPLDVQVALTLDGPSALVSPTTSFFFDLICNDLLTIGGSEGSWDRGSFSGLGSVLVVGEFALVGAGDRLLRIDLANQGTIWQSAPLALMHGSLPGDPVVTNVGEWLGSQAVKPGAGTADARFVNEGGVVRHPGGAGLLRFQVRSDFLGGTVDATGGSIRFDGGGTHDGVGYEASGPHEIHFTVAAGATPVQMAGACATNGDGDVRVSGPLGIAVGGALVANQAPSAPNGLFLDNGALVTANGSLTNHGRMTWRAGTLAGSGPIENGPGGSVQVVPGGLTVPTIDEFTTVTNRGTWTHLTNMHVDVGATLSIVGGGIVDHRAGTISGLGSVAVASDSSLRRPSDAGLGASVVSAATALEGGTIECGVGEIRLTGGGLWTTGSVRPISGVIALNGGVFDLESIHFDGAGELHASGSAVNVAPSWTSRSYLGLDNFGSFRLGEASSATLGGGGTFENLGWFAWKSGTVAIGSWFDGLWVGGLVNLAPGTISTQANGNVVTGRLANEGGTLLLNHGVQVSGNGEIRLGGGTANQTGAGLALTSAAATLRIHGGTWTLAGTSSVTGPGTVHLGGGTLRKTGPQTATVSAPLKLSPLDPLFGFLPSVVVDGGVLAISNLTGEPGIVQWTIAGGGSLQLGSATYTAGQDPALGILNDIDGVVSLGDGRTPPPVFACATLVNGGRIRPGGVDGTGELVIDADLVMQPEGIVSVNLGGHAAGLEHDLLTIDGSAILDGTLRVRLVDGFEPSEGQAFTVASATGAVTGSFASVVGPGAWSATVVGQDVVVTCIAPPTCNGDLTGDGSVGPADLGVLLGAWGFAPSDLADLTDDDDVNAADLGVLLGAWGACQ